MNGWTHSEGTVDETMSFASFVAMWYPSAAGALYLKFGIGGMTYRADDGVDEITATAGSFSLGVGYEIRAGRNFSVTPFFNALATAPVSFKLNGAPASAGQDISMNLVQIGVGVTWH